MELTPEQMKEAVSVYVGRKGKAGRPSKTGGKTLMALAREFGVSRGWLRSTVDRELDRRVTELLDGVTDIHDDK